MEPKMPRDETLERFRKQFFREDNGVGYQEGAKNLEEFKETQIEEFEQGFVMSADQTLGLVTGEGSLSKNLLEKARGIEVSMDYDLELIDLLTTEDPWESDTPLKIGEGAFEPQKVIQVLKVLGDEDELGVVKNIKTYPPAEFGPVLFENEHGEMIALAPTHGGEPVAYEDLVNKEFREAREFAESLRDPNLVRIVDASGTKINIPIDQIEKVEVTGSGISLHIKDWGYSPTITGETLNQLRERIPDLPIKDERTSWQQVDYDKLVEAVSSAWKRRDPLMEDVDGYSKCLDDVAEKMQFGGGLPCSLEFYVEHWGETPRERKYNYRLRSLQTPSEWALALATRIMEHVYKAEFSVGAEFEGARRGNIKLYFEIPELEIPRLSISKAEYKAKHLKQVKSVVEIDDPEHFNTDWRVWELRQIIAQFEVDEVKA